MDGTLCFFLLLPSPVVHAVTLEQCGPRLLSSGVWQGQHCAGPEALRITIGICELLRVSSRFAVKLLGCQHCTVACDVMCVGARVWDVCPVVP